MWGPQTIAKLVELTPISIVYDTHLTAVFIDIYGVYASTS